MLEKGQRATVTLDAGLSSESLTGVAPREV